MDLLFKRYASPYLLLDQMILTEQFSNFMIEVIGFVDDDRLWSFFLHKVQGQSFDEFKNGVSVQHTETADFETTINDSFNIVQGFIPDIS